MQSEHTKYEWIDAYIRQELQGEQLNAFEAELKKNEALRKEVQFRQSMDDVFQLKKLKATIQEAKSDPLLINANALKIEYPELENVHDVIKQAKSENVSYRKRLVKRLVAGIAASLLLLGWAVNQHGVVENSLDEWVDSHFSISPTIELNNITNTEIESVSAKNNEVLDLLAEAKSHYEADQLTDVLATFEKLRKTHSYETDEMLFYEGLIYYENNDPNKAVQTLEQITNRNSAITNEVHWYLGLMHLKMEEKEQAKKHFKQLEVASEQYRKEAKSVLEKLN